jgi:hypothetical protein
VLYFLIAAVNMAIKVPDQNIKSYCLPRPLLDDIELNQFRLKYYYTRYSAWHWRFMRIQKHKNKNTYVFFYNVLYFIWLYTKYNNIQRAITSIMIVSIIYYCI